MPKVLGFYGIESYDIILSLAMVLHNLDLSVSICDWSKDKSLACIIPGLEEESVCEWNDIRVYRDDTIEPAVTDYVIIYFGREENGIELCDEIYMVTDQQKHNVEMMKNLSIPESVYPVVIYRHFLSKITLKYLKHELEDKGIQDNDYLEIVDTEASVLNRVMYQYNVSKGFGKMDRGIVEICKYVAGTDFAENQINTVILRMRKARL